MPKAASCNTDRALNANCIPNILMLLFLGGDDDPLLPAIIRGESAAPAKKSAGKNALQTNLNFMGDPRNVYGHSLHWAVAQLHTRKSLAD
jgi:hypothetical protein